MTDSSTSNQPQEVETVLSSARAEAEAILARMTAKQVEVIERAAKLETNDQIAYDLGVHRRTVEEHLVAARKKLKAKNRTDAIRKYILLLTICGRPTCGFVRVEIDADDMSKILLDLSFEHATEILAAPEFEEYREAFRSTGPEGLDARFGGIWRPVAALLLAFVIIASAVGIAILARIASGLSAF